MSPAYAGGQQEQSLAEHIRERDTMRIQIAKALDKAEAKLKKADKLDAKAQKVEQSAVSHRKEEKKAADRALREEHKAAKLREEAAALRAVGEQQKKEAIEAYEQRNTVN